jgi:hypothetical protein
MYCRIEEVDENTYLYKFEDEHLDRHHIPDWDYEEPVLRVEKIGNKLKFTVEKYTGVYHSDIYYENTLLFYRAGGREKAHVGESKEIEIEPEPLPMVPQVECCQRILDVLNQLRDSIALPKDFLYYHRSTISMATDPFVYLAEHDLNIRSKIGRNIPRLYVMNDGPGDIYAIISIDGTSFSLEESLIKAGEWQIFYNVYWIKLRADLANTSYRLSEYPVERQDKIEVRNASDISAYATYVNPASNPVLTLDTEGRTIVEVWIKSIAGGREVKVYGSRNNSDFRLVDTLTTDGSTREVHSGYFNAYRYVRLELVETGLGTSELEITASR